MNSVPELKVQEMQGSNFVLGAGTSLTTTMQAFNQIATENSQFAYLKQLANHIDLVANVPVRNVSFN